MRDDESNETRRGARAFVPRMTLRRTIAAVVPACALAALGGCEKTEDTHIIVLAMMAFDAAVDPPPPPPPVTADSAPPDAPPHVIMLAVVGFDSALDAGARRGRGRH